MVGWQSHESEQTPGDSEGQGSLACCSPWGCRAGHDLATEQQQFKDQVLIEGVSCSWWILSAVPGVRGFEPFFILQLRKLDLGRYVICPGMPNQKV